MFYFNYYFGTFLACIVGLTTDQTLVVPYDTRTGPHLQLCYRDIEVI